MSSSDGFFCVYKVPWSNRGNLSKTLFCFPTVMCSSSMLKHFLKKNHVIFSLPLVNRFNDWVLWQSFHASSDICFKTVLPSLSVTSRNALLPSLQIGGCRDEVFCTACSMNSGAGALYLAPGSSQKKHTQAEWQLFSRCYHLLV